MTNPRSTESLQRRLLVIGHVLVTSIMLDRTVQKQFKNQRRVPQLKSYTEEISGHGPTITFIADALMPYSNKYTKL